VPFSDALANAEIFLSANGPTTEAAAPAGNTDPMAWNTSAGGAWNTPSLWVDTFLGGAAAVAPGVHNAVTIAAAASSFQVITGDGNSSSLTVSGLLALSGKFDTGALTFNWSPGPDGVAAIASLLDLLAGSTLTAATATVGSSLVVSGAGASLAVSGVLTVGYEAEVPSDISVVDGGAVQAASLTLTAGSGYLPALLIDPTSSFEVGTAGDAAAGELTVDAGATAVLDGQVNTPILDDGTIIIGGGLLGTTTVTGAISGTGMLQVVDGATLVLDGPVAAGPTIDFSGGDGTLNVVGVTTLSAPITGFAVGYVILAAPAATSVSYNFSTGALVLQDATGNPLQTLDMVGSFAGDSFHTVGGASGSEVVLAAGTLQSGPPPAPAPGTAGPDEYTWNTIGGAWGTASNWQDTTAGGTAVVAPGANDIVYIGGSSSWQVISGAGDAASLTVSGAVVFSGNFAATQLFVGGALDVFGAGAAMAVTNTVTLGTLLSIRLPFVYIPGTFDVAGGASVQMGGLSGGSPTYGGAGRIFVDGVSSMEIGTAGGAAAGALSVDAGSSVTAFSLNVFANVVNNGDVAIGQGSTLAIAGTVSGTGVVQLGAGDTGAFGGDAVGAGQTVELVGNDTLDLSPGGAFAALLSGFAPGDVISVAAPVTAASWAAAPGGTGTLTLSDDGTPIATVTLAGDYSGDTFLVTPGPAESSITLVPAVVACFAEGTRILTDRGLVAVEALRAGDAVVSAFGGLRPVRWIGHRRIELVRHPRPQDVLPVRVQAHAFGLGRPYRDLLLSPDHAVFVDEVLIPVRCLLNGATIVQAQCTKVTYFHVELPAHEVILAEGLPCESYLDLGNRGAFDNGGGAVLLHPDFATRIWQRDACAELILGGPRSWRRRGGG
jgi:collagen type I/II/III/V/XI/XXIV/XXVII alpha